MGSRILAMLLAFVQSFAAKEMAAATPYVQKAVGELSDDIKASKPLVAFTKTAHDAMEAMAADPNVVPSLTGVLGATAQAISAL